MTATADLIDELVAANHILAFEGVVDGFGHISVRHPDRPDRFLLSRARAPRMVEPSDIMEFTLDGAPVDARGRSPYSERFIHAALYQARPEVKSVVHSHSHATISFGVGGEKLRPIMHNCALIGKEVPIWDARDKFGDTDLMVTNIEMGRDLASTIGSGPSALMRGHGTVAAGGSIRRACYVSIKLQDNANLQREASRYKEIKFLSPGEVEKMIATLDAYGDKPLLGIDRAWEYWCDRAGVRYRPGY
jgi:HCOMODA/2-hydroxy-3-carboxy-muconic semialdehyde decarboxylase